MQIQLQINMNEKLFLRDPGKSELGKSIILHSIQLIHLNGLELVLRPTILKTLSLS